MLNEVEGRLGIQELAEERKCMLFPIIGISKETLISHPVKVGRFATEFHLEEVIEKLPNMFLKAVDFLFLLRSRLFLNDEELLRGDPDMV